MRTLVWQSAFPIVCTTHLHNVLENGLPYPKGTFSGRVALVLLAMTVEILKPYATDRSSANFTVGWFLKCVCLSRQCSTPRQGDKRSAPQGYLLRGTAADLIASHAPLRSGLHKARQNPPKHELRGFKGPQPLGTPFSSIFRRAAKDGVPVGNALGVPPEVVGLVVR